MCEKANNLAKERGYNGLADIDDPGLREWIINKSISYSIFGKKIHCGILTAFTTAVGIFLTGLLLGMMMVI